MHPLDSWRAANLLIQQHGADAALHAAMRVDVLREAGDEAGAAVWTRIIKAVDALQRTNPQPGEAQH